VTKTLKIGILLLVLLCVALVVIILIDFPLENKVSGDVIESEESVPAVDEDQDLTDAVVFALEAATGRWAEFAYDIDHIQLQEDEQMAIVWLAAINPETGESIGREPELAIAERDAEGRWQVLLEDEENFIDIFSKSQMVEKNFEGDFLTEDQAQAKSGKVFGGYYLPWAANLEKRLTWSVGHTSCYPIYYCTHAFDFADGTMFPIVASKGGAVFHWKDTCANGNTSCTNSITLQDKSTTPWTYQIYLHIAQGSVPSSLKKVGTPVLQGQYIANVDDTGYSTGHHVHFMVVSEDTRYFSGGMESVWGVAEDITFRDVDINWDEATQGGRPRLAYEAASYGGEGRTYYISGNAPANPPTGGMTKPATKTYITTRKMTVAGWGRDDVGVVKYEILANYNGSWLTIGEKQAGNSFTTEINLCETDVPDGPFKLALRVWDYEGNFSGLSSPVKLIKGVDCGASGSDPEVTLNITDGILALPQQGFVSASVSEGSAGDDIVSVVFWFHKKNWNKNEWVKLGTDTNGTNGWQAPIDTSDMGEGSTYGLLVVATDSTGKQDADLSFKAIIDHTRPWVNFEPISSPYQGNKVTFNWTGGDELTKLDHYDLGVYWDSGPYQALKNNLPPTTTTYQLSVSPEQILIFEVRAFDISGNVTSRKISVYTEGYEFPYNYVFSTFFNNSD